MLGTTTTRAAANTAASSAKLVRPPRSTATSPATAAVSAASSGLPVTTTRWPAPASAATIAALRDGLGRRAGTAAPGWNTTNGRGASCSASRAGSG
ncbi:hypothetical protein D522_18734, partial [Mycobacterium avium subsp. paratuberculosis S5]